MTNTAASAPSRNLTNLSAFRRNWLFWCFAAIIFLLTLWGTIFAVDDVFLRHGIMIATMFALVVVLLRSVFTRSSYTSPAWHGEFIGNKYLHRLFVTVREIVILAIFALFGVSSSTLLMLASATLLTLSIWLALNLTGRLDILSPQCDRRLSNALDLSQTRVK